MELKSNSLRKEAQRAARFFVGQIRRGDTPADALLQVRTAYGCLVWAQLKWDLQEYYNMN